MAEQYIQVLVWFFCLYRLGRKGGEGGKYYSLTSKGKVSWLAENLCRTWDVLTVDGNWELCLCAT